MQNSKVRNMMDEFNSLKKQADNTGKRRSSKEYDVLNLMLLSAFDNSIAKTRANPVNHRQMNSLYPSKSNDQGGYQYDKGPYGREFGNVGDAFAGLDPFYFAPNAMPTSSRQGNPATAASRGGGGGGRGGGYGGNRYYQQQPPPLNNNNAFMRNSMQIIQQPQLNQSQLYNNPNPYYAQSMPTLPNQSQFIQPATTTAQRNPLQSQPYQVPKYDPLVETIEKQNKLLEGLASNLGQGSQEKDSSEKALLEKRLKNLEKMHKKLTSSQDEDLNFIKNNQLQQHQELNQVFNPYNPQYFNKMQQSMAQNQMMPPWMKMQQPNTNQQSLENMKLLMLLKKVQADNEQLRKMKIQHVRQPVHASKGKSKKGKKKGKKRTKGDDDDDDQEEDDDEEDQDYGGGDDDQNDDEDYDDDDDDDDDDESEYQDSKQKKEEEEKKKLAQHQAEIAIELKSIGLRFRFLGRYFKAVKASILNRRTTVNESMPEDIKNAFMQGTEWVQQVCSRGLNMLIDVSAKCDVNPKSKVSIKESQTRVDNLKARVKALLDGIMDGFEGEEMESYAQMLQFFGFITHDYQFPPQNFLFKFEINRLKFTSFGALKEMNSKSGQMVILLFLIIRILLYKIVLKPWEVMEKVKESIDLKINIKAIASVIYLITMDYLRGICAVQHDNQKFLSVDMKIKEKPGFLRANNDPIDADVMKEAQKNDEPLILGLFTKEELPQIFEEQKDFVDMMKSLVQGFGEKIYEYCDQQYKDDKKQEKQENMAQLMQDNE